MLIRVLNGSAHVDYRRQNGFVNLALPFVSFSEPIAPPKVGGSGRQQAMCALIGSSIVRSPREELDLVGPLRRSRGDFAGVYRPLQGPGSECVDDLQRCQQYVDAGLVSILTMPLMPLICLE
jgi:hypothetical protein